VRFTRDSSARSRCPPSGGCPACGAGWPGRSRGGRPRLGVQSAGGGAAPTGHACAWRPCSPQPSRRARPARWRRYRSSATTDGGTAGQASRSRTGDREARHRRTAATVHPAGIHASGGRPGREPHRRDRVTRVPGVRAATGPARHGVRARRHGLRHVVIACPDAPAEGRDPVKASPPDGPLTGKSSPLGIRRSPGQPAAGLTAPAGRHHLV
jgi:hypothetical protein